jgi:hypothetical protein
MQKEKTETQKSYVEDRNPFKHKEDNNPVNYSSGAYGEVFNPEELFQGENSAGGEQNQAKELFNPKNPKVKSEFSDREIKILCRLYSLSKLYYECRGTYILKETLDEFVIERISKERKSRLEFVEAHKEAKKDAGNSFFNKLLGGNMQ